MTYMGEIIKCIRVIKFNAWEELFIKKIEGFFIVVYF